MIMANNNPYFNEQQRKQFLEGKKAQEEPRQQRIRQITAKLDKESLKELKDINDNTLETALNTMDVKEGIKSFENKFSEKFSEFQEQLKQEEEVKAADSSEFVGPPRPSNLTDNSSASVDNSVSITNTSGDSLKKIEANTENMVASFLSFMDIYEKQISKVPDVTPARPEEPTLDDRKQDKDDKDDKKDKKKLSSSLIQLLKDIKGNTSNILSRFIGYSLEALAKFAKWTLIIGSVVFAIDVLSKVITAWFKDILNEGQASKDLFGSYLPQIKKIMTSIEKGLDNFDMDNLGKSISNLLSEPLKDLGAVIKTAITEGIGNLITAMGEYTGSDTLTDMGKSMKLSALKDKQAAGLDINGDDVMLLKEQEIKDQEKTVQKTSGAVMSSAPTSNWENKNSYNQMGQLEDKQKQLAELKKVDAAREAADREQQRLEQMKKDLEAMKKDPNLRESEAKKENDLNRERVKKDSEMKAKMEQAAKANESDLDKAQEYVDKEDITADDSKKMEKILSSLEEKNNAHELSDDDSDRWRELLEQWQNKISAVPDSSAAIDKPESKSGASGQTAQNSTVNVNNKTVNNTVQHSIQRTEIKPLVSFA